MFAILKAFSQGATALTGVEAISNGVPAFKRPRRGTRRRPSRSWGRSPSRCSSASRGWRRTCTASSPASNGRPSRRSRSRLRERLRVLRRAVLHRGDPDPGGEHRVSGLPPARLDPRARPVHAEPVRQPRRSLVFSNGVIVLGLLSCVMIYALRRRPQHADPLLRRGRVHLVHLSQTGMVRHWLAEGRKGDAAMTRVAPIDRDQHHRGDHDVRSCWSS